MALSNPNPILTSGFNDVYRGTREKMTLEGTVQKSALLLGIMVVVAVFTFQAGQAAMVFLLPAIILAVVLAIVAAKKPEIAHIVGPIFAAVEGVVVGSITAIYEGGYAMGELSEAGGAGLVISAVGLTVGIFVALLAIYSTGIIKPSENFKLGVASATMGIMLFYVAALIGGLAFGYQMPLIWSNGIFGILFSLFVVGLASMNLVVDFDFIEHGVEHGAPKHMEWLGAIGLLATLVWLYIEVLRLLAKLQSRN